MKKRIEIIKKLDHMVGPLLLKIIPHQKTNNDAFVLERVLIIRPGGMGDALLLLPSIKEIKSQNSGIKIDVLCEKRNSSVFNATDYIDQIYYYDNPIHLIKLFKNKYDVIVDTEQFYRLSAILTFFLRGRKKVGYGTNERSKVFHISIRYQQQVYEMDCFRDLILCVFDLSKKSTLNFPYFIKTDGHHALNGDTLGACICFFPGGTKKECYWPVERWAKLIDGFTEMGYQAVLIGGPLECGAAEEIVSMCKSKGLINLTGRLSLLESVELFNNAKLLISTDSGILHLGVLSGIPTVSLFGSGNPYKWGPKGENDVVITKKLACSPCAWFGSVPDCRYHVKCMDLITCDDVFTAAKKILNK